MPEKTYALHNEEKRIYGFISGKEAIEQAIYKILSTERYEWEIYSDDYGSELGALYGQPKSYVKDEAEDIIKTALLQDSRILEVSDFQFYDNKKSVIISFKVKTEFGDLNIEKEIGGKI